MKSIPRQFTSIYLVRDTYCAKSIKAGERLSRDQGKRYVLRSQDMKIPSDFDDFLGNGNNKRMLLDLTEESLVEGREKLGPRKIFFSNVEYCCFTDTSQTHLIPELASDHKEPDTRELISRKLIAWLECNDYIRSGDLVILVLFLLHSARLVDIQAINNFGKLSRILEEQVSSVKN